MNLVTELENELVFALLVEKKSVESANPAKALALIDKIKAALLPNSVKEKERKTKMGAEKKLNFFSH